MRKYYVRVGQSHALVETDNGVLAAIRLFDTKIHPIDFVSSVEVREMSNHIREQSK